MFHMPMSSPMMTTMFGLSAASHVGAAPGSLDYACRDDLAGHQVVHLALSLRRAVECIGAGGGVLQRGECPGLGNDHRHRLEDGGGLSDVFDCDLDLHDAGAGLVDH